MAATSQRKLPPVRGGKTSSAGLGADFTAQDGRVVTPVGSAPILPLLLLGAGAYLMWFAIHYWRGTGPAVWPSYPIKSVLQGRGVPAGNPATASAPSTNAGNRPRTLAAARRQAAAKSGGFTAAPTAAQNVGQYESQVTGQIALASSATPITLGGTGPNPGPNPNPGPGPPPDASETMIMRAICAAIGAPQTTANVNSLHAWRVHETPWPPVAKFNPMNTTLAMPGSTCYNSVCVRNYTSWAQGVAATAETLQGGYSCIVSALRSGLGVCGTRCSANFSKWSGGGYSSVC